MAEVTTGTHVVTGDQNQLGLLMKYFVLNPHKDDPYGASSRIAVKAYANAIEPTNPNLAAHLRHWVETIQIHISKKGEPL